MFIEPSKNAKSKGWIEVICGSMFSGKTEELIRRLKRAQLANQKVEIYKPSIDIRYDSQDIVSHNDNRVLSTPVENSQHILLMHTDAEVVAIDEAQFFDSEITYVAEQLASKGVRVIIAGLDMDFKGIPFGPMPALLAKADYITKLHAICMKCGDIANYSFRKTAIEDKVVLGEHDTYEARCRSCFYNG